MPKKPILIGVSLHRGGFMETIKNFSSSDTARNINKQAV
jgi:hypothetical protein